MATQLAQTLFQCLVFGGEFSEKVIFRDSVAGLLHVVPPSSGEVANSLIRFPNGQRKATIACRPDRSQ